MHKHIVKFRMGGAGGLNLGEGKGRTMARATAASGDVGTGGTSLGVKVQRFGSYVDRVVIRAEGEDGEE